MLVYANNMTFLGEKAEEAIFKAVGGWTKEKLGYGLHPEQLKLSGDYKGKLEKSRSRLLIDTATEQFPKLYSWVLTHLDEKEHRRQWNTELGLKISEDTIQFSCVLETKESSTSVQLLENPSKPRIVEYVMNNVREEESVILENPVGEKVNEIGKDEDSYRAFLYEVERTERQYPLVLVSPNWDGEYLIDSKHLQDELVGIAQVVRVLPTFDRYEMIDVLGEKWAARDGTVKIIHIPKKTTGDVWRRYFPPEAIEEWGDTPRERISHLLKLVTNETNIAQKKNSIRPEGVRSLALKRRMEATLQRVGVTHEELLAKLKDANEHATRLGKENKELENKHLNTANELRETNQLLEIAEEERDNAKSDLVQFKSRYLALQARTDSLEEKLKSSGNTPEENPSSLNEIENWAEKNLSGKVELHPRAIKEASQSDFEDIDLIYNTLLMLRDFYVPMRLGKVPLEAYMEKLAELKLKDEKCFNQKGKAKNFGGEYFVNYQGKKRELECHLKGRSNRDERYGFRLYYFWDDEMSVVVVGHLPSHLKNDQT